MSILGFKPSIFNVVRLEEQAYGSKMLEFEQTLESLDTEMETPENSLQYVKVQGETGHYP